MKKFIYSLALFSLVLMMTLTSLFLVSFNEAYFDKMYRKLEVAKTVSVDEESLMDVNNLLLSYIKGQASSLDYLVQIDDKQVEFFNQKEKDHMVDVQVLYLNAKLVRNVSFLLALAGLVVLLVSKDYQDNILMHDILGKVLLAYGFIIGALGIVALLDFDFFWTSFHQLVFTNDLWLLNPQTDRLIMMVPLEFFMGLVYRILAALALIFGALLASYKIVEKKVRL